MLAALWLARAAWPHAGAPAGGDRAAASGAASTARIATSPTTQRRLPTATPGAIPRAPDGQWFVELVFTAWTGDFAGQAGAHGSGVSCGVWELSLPKSATARILCPIPAAQHQQLRPNAITTVDYGAVETGDTQTLTVTNPSGPYSAFTA